MLLDIADSLLLLETLSPLLVSVSSHWQFLKLSDNLISLKMGHQPGLVLVPTTLSVFTPYVILFTLRALYYL